MSSLGDILRNAGLSVVDNPVAGRPGVFEPQGVMLHHTAGNYPSDLSVITNGRSDLPGPLTQLYIAPDGTVHVITEGRANHAGTGVWDKDGFSVPTDKGNDMLIGIEVSSMGAEPISGVQYIVMIKAAAALSKHYGWDEHHTILHRSYAPTRKVDIRNDLDLVQADIKAQLGGDMALSDEDVERIANAVWAKQISVVGYDSPQSIGSVQGWTYRNTVDTKSGIALVNKNLWDAVVTRLDRIISLVKSIGVTETAPAEPVVDYEAIADAVADEIDDRDRDRLGPA